MTAEHSTAEEQRHTQGSHEHSRAVSDAVVTLPADWEQVIDEDSGDHYYWNRVTDEVTWDCPNVDSARPPATGE